MWGWMRAKGAQVEVDYEPHFQEMVDRERARLRRLAEERDAQMAAWHERFAVVHRAEVLRKVRTGRRRVRWSRRSTVSPVPPRGPRINHAWIDEAWELGVGL